MQATPSPSLKQIKPHTSRGRDSGLGEVHAEYTCLPLPQAFGPAAFASFASCLYDLFIFPAFLPLLSQLLLSVGVSLLLLLPFSPAIWYYMFYCILNPIMIIASVCCMVSVLLLDLPCFSLLLIALLLVFSQPMGGPPTHKLLTLSTLLTRISPNPSLALAPPPPPPFAERHVARLHSPHPQFSPPPPSSHDLRIACFPLPSCSPHVLLPGLRCCRARVTHPQVCCRRLVFPQAAVRPRPPPPRAP